MIYISGKITGDPDYEEKFKKAERYLNYNYGTLEVCNPASYKGMKDLSWEDAIIFCIGLLQHTDVIYMLSDWQDSRGACFEYGYALGKGMKIIFED